MENKMAQVEIVKDNMVIDPSLQKEIIDRVLRGNFGDNPDQAIHSLGTVQTPDGKDVPLYLRHAVDAILIDSYGNIVLITRQHNPGAGLQALPGGFIDPVKGVDGTSVVEKAVTAALREAAEETGISERLLAGAQVISLGNRSYNRPFDIRAAWSDMPDTEIKKGDFFAVSTQGFCVLTQEDLSQISLKAGDDAAGVHVAKISELAPDQFGIPDHLLMIQAACTAIIQPGPDGQKARQTDLIGLNIEPIAPR